MDRVDILKGLSHVIDLMDDDLDGCITMEDEAAIREAYKYILTDQQNEVRASINKAIANQSVESIRSKAFIEGYRSAMMDVLDKVM